jgi:hypothetical protein
MTVSWLDYNAERRPLQQKITQQYTRHRFIVDLCWLAATTGAVNEKGRYPRSEKQKSPVLSRAFRGQPFKITPITLR